MIQCRDGRLQHESGGRTIYADNSALAAIERIAKLRACRHPAHVESMVWSANGEPVAGAIRSLIRRARP
jgi:hypothetical protein